MVSLSIAIYLFTLNGKSGGRLDHGKMGSLSKLVSHLPPPLFAASPYSNLLTLCLKLFKWATQTLALGHFKVDFHFPKLINKAFIFLECQPVTEQNAVGFQDPYFPSGLSKTNFKTKTLFYNCII